MSGFFGYRFPSERLARLAWEQTEKGMRSARVEELGSGGGLWRTREEPTGKHCVLIYDGNTDRIERIVQGIAIYRRGERFELAEDLQRTLLLRRARTGLHGLLTGQIREDGVIDQRGRYSDQGPAGGLFLHRDGALHPFPEPKGQG